VTAPARGERVHAFDRGQDAEDAVVAARVAHGVEVGAEHEAGEARLRAFIASRAIADRIERGLHACLAHPAEHEYTRVTPPGSSERRASASQRSRILPGSIMSAVYTARE
jgi:hypothetical protein